MRLAAALVCVVAAGPALASPEAEIRGRLEQWRDDFNAGRADRVCALFAPDLVASYLGRPDIDHAGQCGQLHRALAMPDRKFRYGLEIQDILADGDLAAVRLIWTLDVTGPAVTAEHGRDQGLDLFRRQPDGQWRITRFIAYPLP